MRVMLFGGAFDPPHLGHQQIATGILQQGIADAVWYVPVHIHSFAKNMSEAQHRLALLELIQQPGTRIETYELNESTTNYTFNTLDALSAQYPEHTFSWVIGTDNLAQFHLWGDRNGRTYTEMLAKYPFYVYPRHGYPFQPLYAGMTALTNLPEINVSSSQVRELLQSGKSISDLVTPAVAAYIQKYQLYQ
jgi:nicotinate-nucleotide adenylyltransferase